MNDKGLRLIRGLQSGSCLVILCLTLAFLGQAGFVFAAHPSKSCTTVLTVSDTLSAHLRPLEVQAIQAVVNQLGRDLVVVGSAASAKRRNVGVDSPIGKGSSQKSDIDYILPVKSEEQGVGELFASWHRSLLNSLPDLDEKHGVMMNRPLEGTNRIWFRPNAEPVLLQAGEANLSIPPFNLTPGEEREIADHFFRDVNDLLKKLSI